MPPPLSFKGIAIPLVEGERIASRVSVSWANGKMPTRLLQIIDRNDDRLSTSFDHARTSGRVRFFSLRFFFFFFISFHRRHRWNLSGRVHLSSNGYPTDRRPPSPPPNGTWSWSRLISRGIMFSDCHESISADLRPRSTFLIPPLPLPRWTPTIYLGMP